MRFEIDWLGTEYGSPAERASFGALKLSVGDVTVTEIYDTIGKTVRPSARLSIVALGRWLATNWWRLRWEPSRDDSDWRMSHEMAAAGGGYLWPPVCLTSDGEYISLKARSQHTKTEMVRYLRSCDVQVPISEFETAVDQLMEQLLARLSASSAGDAELVELWHEVLRERKDRELTALRRHEAFLGLDPDSADVEHLTEYAQWMGEAALDEVLAASTLSGIEGDILRLKDARDRTETKFDLTSFEQLTAQVQPLRGKWPVPWQRGAAAARLVRDSLGLKDSQQVSSDSLSNILGESILEAEVGKCPIAAGFRQPGSLWSVSATLQKSRATSRRFEVARLLGDTLFAKPADSVLPITRSETARQKVQRSFAQELLCPEAGLRALVGTTTPDEETVAQAAEHYDVSDWAVITTLVNKGICSRDLLELMH